LVQQQSKEEILDFIDQYDDVSVDECLQFERDPYLRKYAPADGPNLTISNKEEDLELQTIDGDLKFRVDEDLHSRNLRLALNRIRRSNNKTVTLDHVWELYQALPEPRPYRIPKATRHLLLATLASVERKDQKSMLRYFTVVADIRNCGYALTSWQWNSALSFASRYVSTVTEVEVEAALQLWRQMEKETNVKANDVTFNILFDVASKAGKFDLAEMIYREMRHRGFAFSRYHYVSLIHFFGLKQDSGGVRAAYKEMVNAGEVIDTTVLNCLIASFIRCGEEASAERIYEKMKASNKDLPVLPDRNYAMKRAITKVFKMFARIGKEHPDLLPGFQKTALLTPDLHTYRILINHYGKKLGDLGKVAQFLDEMKLVKVPVHGAIFLALFEAFATHGRAGSEWSAERLNSVWEAFLGAVDSEADDLRIETWLAMAALEAHGRYATRDEMLDIYECLQSRWELDHTNSEFMLNFLKKVLNNNHLHAQKPRWAMDLV
jgi:pentatricopeptide repeat protein